MTVPPPPRRRPPGRDDERSRVAQRSLAVLLGLLFVGLVGAILLLAFTRLTGDSLEAKVISYDVQAEDRVVLDVQVSKQAGGTAYCVIRARSRDGAEVGRDIAVLDAEGTPSRTARGTFTLATTARAVTGELSGCRAEPISRRDIEP